MGHPDFFISRAGADKGAADAIADIVREAGLEPFYQDEHFGHADFMRMMEQGFEHAAKLIVLLSEDYQKSEHCRKEYNTFLAGDPANLNKRVIVFRVSNCAPAGMLATLAYTDLVPVLNNCGALRQAVREALGIDKRTPGSISSMLARAGQQILHPNIRPVKGFIGRRRKAAGAILDEDEGGDDLLDALARKLAAKSSVAIRNSTQTTLAMRGLGGVGKTALAQEFAWRNRARYHGVWWVRAEKPETLLDDLAALGARFIPSLAGLEPEKAARATVDQLAQMRTEKPWLLVYDNAEGPAALRGFTPADNADVLITTRRANWLREADEELSIDVFDRDTAVAFLTEVRANDAEAAGRLADALGYLPLALSHACAYCVDNNMSFDAYAAKLSELMAEAPEDAPKSVFATFNIAIEGAAEKCADAETLMALFAFFAPDKIPLWLIPETLLAETQRRKALAALTRVSLAAYDKSSDGAEAVSLHRLVQEAMRARLRAAGRFEETAALAIRLLYDAYDRKSATVESAHHRSVWLPHAAANLDHAPRGGEAARQTVWVCIFIGDFRTARGDLSGALDAYGFGQRIAEAAARSQPDNDQWQRNLSVSYNRVGGVQAAQGKLGEALASFQASLAIFERLATADPGNAGWQRDLSVSYNRVGEVLVAQGKLGEALASSQASLAIRERLAKADPENAEWQRNLSVSYARVGDAFVAQGKLGEALASFQASLAIAERLAKADPGNAEWQRDLSVSYNKVGGVQAAQGKLGEALASFQASLAIRERLAKADPGNAGWQRDLAVSHAKLADVYGKQGETGKARGALAAGREIMARMTKLAPDHAVWKRDLAWFEAEIAALDGAAPREEKTRGLLGRLFGRKG